VDPSADRRILDFRPLGFRDVLVLGRYQYCEAHAPLELHTHRDIVEICYLHSGQQTYFVGTEEFDLRGGSLFVTYPNEPHGSDKTPESKGVLYWMLLDVPACERQLLSLAPAESRLVLDAILDLPARHFPATRNVASILRHLMAQFDREGDRLRPVRLKTLLLSFLLEVLEASASHSVHCHVSPAIQSVKQTIDRELDKPLSIRHLARLAHMSESRFKARFKAEIGMPPADYMTRQRIDRAKEFVRQTDMSVTEIAGRLGFCTTQYFATSFKRYTGQTPSDYRRQSVTGFGQEDRARKHGKRG
jgi:AraC-like DNA-binding protein